MSSAANPYSNWSSMDILRPPIVRIGKRRYRTNPHLRTVDGQRLPDEEEEVYTEGGKCCVWDDEICDANINIKEIDGGQFSINMDVPTAYFKFIIGIKGETKKRLETETQTQIRVPKPGQDDDIVIVGRDKKGVISAKTRIDLLVNSARQKQPFTHFLSFPVDIKNSFHEFKTDVLLQCDGDRGLDNTIFQNHDKLHMTVGMLVLMNDSEIKQAQQILQECQDMLVNPILRGSPLTPQVCGLEYMNDDPAEVDVLYAKLHFSEESDRLQILADRLVDKFSSSGLMQQEYDSVKLHITVINSLMRKDPSGTPLPSRQHRRGPPRESFDARSILKTFGNYDFGEYHMKELHLSKRYSKDKSGYYGNDGILKLP